ncbi:MAG: DUF4390 domain-containing protein [Cytophagales bacterium]|nr:DUF4390 domain-containing protein [Cytophagales bacterium]
MKKQLLKFSLGLMAVWLCMPLLWAQTGGAEILNFKATRMNSDVAISADIKFDLPSSIEEAMYKGVSLTFVSELEVVKARWYWTDKTIATASRQTRISYQALTRRWRVLPWAEGLSPSGLGVQLPQTYETLAEALTVAQRIYNWRVMSAVDVDDTNYWMQLSYRLDISQLPKPLQIGLLGKGDWSINATLRQRMQLTGAAP